MSKTRAYSAWVLLILMSLGLIALAVFVTPIKTIGSGSMEPTLPVGSRIIIHEQTSYDVGDIITFRADDGDIVTHRLVEYGEGGTLITKGDANPTPDVWDEPLTESDVVGKVIFTTAVTTLDFWKTQRGIGIILCLVVIAIALRWRTDDDSDADKELSDNPA